MVGWVSCHVGEPPEEPKPPPPGAPFNNSAPLRGGVKGRPPPPSLEPFKRLGQIFFWGLGQSKVSLAFRAN